MANQITSNPTTSEEFFEAMYRRTPDPWNFTASEYEQSRYESTLEALRGCRFRRGFEPGCSIGVLTEQLAGFCDCVEGLEISETAVQQARHRCRHLPNVRVEHGRLPEATPEGQFDLILLSEIGYYFDEAALVAMVHDLFARLETGGVLLGVHWLGTSRDHILSGDRVHELIAAAIGLASVFRSGIGNFELKSGLRNDCAESLAYWRCDTSPE